MTTGGLLTSKERKAAEQRARCAGWRPISYSASKDTKQTVGEVRTHNKTGLNKGCPKFKAAHRLKANV